MDASGRRAISLLEVIVCIAIMAVSIGLTLPAIQMARKASIRAQSANKLRQIVIATHHYAADHSNDLAGFEWSHTGRDSDGAFRPLLPYLEAENAEIPNPHDPHGSEYVHAFISPEDLSFAKPLIGPGSKEGSHFWLYGSHSYPANWQAMRTSANLHRSFPDGTSTTIAFAERFSRCRETESTWWSTYDGPIDRTIHINAPQFESNPSGRRPTFADPNYDDVQPVTVNGRTRPSIGSFTFQVMPAIENCDYRMPQALHPGGLLSSYMDGSVRTTRAGIRPEVFWSLVTPAGGENVVDE